MSSSEYTELSQVATEEAEGDKDSASSAGGGAAEEKPLLEQDAEQSDGTPPAGTAAELEAAVTLLRKQVEALTPQLERQQSGQDAAREGKNVFFLAKNRPPRD